MSHTLKVQTNSHRLAWLMVSSLFIVALVASTLLRSALVHANGSGFSGSGSGTTADPYLVTSCAQFEDINNNDDGYDGFSPSYKLTQNLNCTSQQNAIEANGSFSGVFDGNNHSITVDIAAADSNVGLFTMIDGGVISNLTVAGTITGQSGAGNLGALAGAIQNGAMINAVTVTATVNQTSGSMAGDVAGIFVNSTADHVSASGSVTSDSGGLVGGLFGGTYCGGTIVHSHASGAVTAAGDNVGGLVGQDGCEGPGSTFTDDYATGNVVSSGSNVGGLIGDAIGTVSSQVYATGTVTGGGNSTGGLIGDAEYNTSITQAYATGAVHGSGNSTGGLAGLISDGSSVSQSFATGSVHGDASNIGGLVGIVDAGSTVSNSYARGAVLGGDVVGGLIGRVNSGSVHTSYATGSVDTSAGTHGGLVASQGDAPTDGNFWDTQTSGTAASDLGTGETTAQMKSIATYTSLSTPGLGSTAWDFTDHPGADDGSDDYWSIGTTYNDGYPCLNWSSVCSSVAMPSEDNDGVTTASENAAPNNGDANDDSSQDGQQPNVASFPSSQTGNYVSVASPSACSLSAVSDSSQASTGVTDGDYTYPQGLISYTASCGNNGYTATMHLYFYGTMKAGLELRKYNPVTHSYAAVPNATLSDVTVGGQNAVLTTYTITDGSSLDADGSANGIIVDPVGLAATTSQTSGSAGGSTGSSTASDVSSGSLSDTGIDVVLLSTISALLLAVATLTVYGHRIKRSATA